MNEIPEDQLNKIVEALNKRGATRPCPRCGNRDFTIVPGYLNHPLQSNLTGLSIGGPSIPSVVVICTNCGYLCQHALGTLGLLPKKGETRSE